MHFNHSSALSIIHVDKCMTCHYKYRSWACWVSSIYQRNQQVTTSSITYNHELKTQHLNWLFYSVSFHHNIVHDIDVSKDVLMYQRS